MTKTNKSTERTSYHGITITATLDSLIEVIGEPDVVKEGLIIWDCETDERDVFTIYSFEEDLEKEVTFRIGSFFEGISQTAKEELLELLNQ